MPEPASKLKIHLNLLHPQGIPVPVTVKMLKWLLSYGRFFAIGVEIFVVAMFIFRFKLDAELADTQKKINEQIPFIENLNSDVAKLAQVQNKLKIVNKNINNNVDWQNLMTKLASETPNGVTLTSLSLDHSEEAPVVQLKMLGEATSNNDLAIFLNGLKQDSTFQNIELTNIGYNEGKLTFTITGGTK